MEQEKLRTSYDRLNNFEWDDSIGRKPCGFDDMPAFIPFLTRFEMFLKGGGWQRTKDDYIWPELLKLDWKLNKKRYLSNIVVSAVTSAIVSLLVKLLLR